MTRSRRPPRRQGVVYGPEQDRDRGYEATSLVGRILGLLAVVGAVGVLAIGAVTILRGDAAAPPGATPTATAAAGASASPRSTPFVSATVRPSPTAPPSTPSPSVGSPSPGPTAGASPVELEVRTGPGFVTFGTQNNPALRIVNPSTSFGPQERITWSAHLTTRANADDLGIEISRVDPVTGSEQLVREDAVRPRVNDVQIFLRRIRPNEALDGPGLYVVRYVRGDTVMSEGYFEVRAG